MHAQKMLKTEFARYVISRALVAAEKVLGKDTSASLTHMHSARIFITLADAKKNYFGHKIQDILSVKCAASGLSLISSSLYILSGDKKVSRIAEGLYLSVHAAAFLRAYMSVRKSLKALNEQSRGQTQKNLQKMSLYTLSVCLVNILEGVSLFFGGPAYLGVSILRAGIYIWYYHGNILNNLLSKSKQV